MTQGLYSKYIVLRKDGKPAEGVFFVLKPQSDIHARVAVMAYAESCKETKPKLAEDLLRWLGQTNKPFENIS